jgi:hypothetical protein
LKLKNNNEALEYVERGISRTFLKMLAATKIKHTTKLTTELESLLEKEERDHVKLREIEIRHLKKTRTVIEPGCK